MEEIIKINIEQLEGLLRDKEYAKEWKADKYYELMRENIRLGLENEKLKGQQDYWDREYVKQSEKTMEYRDKYLKWKRKAKELREQRKQGKKQNREEKKCFNCNKQGHFARECREIGKEIKKKIEKCHICGKENHKWNRCRNRPRCEKCNKKGHTENVCRNKEE